MWFRRNGYEDIRGALLFLQPAVWRRVLCLASEPARYMFPSSFLYIDIDRNEMNIEWKKHILPVSHVIFHLHG